MDKLQQFLITPSEAYTYRDRDYEGSAEQLAQDLARSGTLYVGNLSFYTTEAQIYELFSKCGDIRRIIMGLNKNTHTPCGFCFVEYYTHQDAVDCEKWLNGVRLDDRIIRTALDAGFKEGRQYGRGKSGGQVRDEFRTDYDPGRGGFGLYPANVEQQTNQIPNPSVTLGKRSLDNIESSLREEIAKKPRTNGQYYD